MDSVSTTSPIVGPLSWLVACTAALLGATPLLAFGGLVVPAQLIFPVATVAGGLLAGLVASWIYNAFTPDSSSRILTVSGATTVAALVGAASTFLLMLLPFPIIVALVFDALLIGSVAAWAASRFRTPTRSLGRDALLSLGLLVAGGLLIIGALYGFCTTVLTCSA